MKGIKSETNGKAIGEIKSRVLSQRVSRHDTYIHTWIAYIKSVTTVTFIFKRLVTQLTLLVCQQLSSLLFRTPIDTTPTPSRHTMEQIIHEEAQPPCLLSAIPSAVLHALLLTNLSLEDLSQLRLCSKTFKRVATQAVCQLKPIKLSSLPHLDPSSLQSLHTLDLTALNHNELPTDWLACFSLPTFRSLTSLTIGKNHHITLSRAAAISSISQLVHLALQGNTITDPSLSMLTDRLCNLKTFSLRDCAFLTDYGLSSLSNLTLLQEIDLCMCWKLTDTTLSALGSLKHLSRLDLSHCEQFTAAGLAALGQGATSLQTLSIPACWQISDDHLEAIATHMPQLGSLGMFGSGETVSDTGVGSLQYLSSLTALDMGYSCWFHTSQGLQHLLTHLTALKMLNLSGCEAVCDDTLSVCMGMRSIGEEEGGGGGGENTVAVDHQHHRHHGDAVLTNNKQSPVLQTPYLAQLTRLDLSECQRVTPQGLTHIGNLRNLVDLNLGWNFRLSPGALSCLLGNRGEHRQRDSEVPSVPLYHHYPSPLLLSHLDLSFCGELTDDALKTIAHLPMLKSLVLRKCIKLTDTGISYLANRNGRKIEALDLSYCTGLSERTAYYVSQLPCLEKLTMAACPGITTPLSMAQLRGGEVYCSSGCLRYLNMSDNQGVDDECLIALTGSCGGENTTNSSLVELNLRRCSKITDKGVLVGLQHMKQLRRLNVGLCVNVSERALSELQRRLPLLKRVMSPHEESSRSE